MINNKNPESAVRKEIEKQTKTCDHEYFLADDRRTYGNVTLLFHSSANVEANGIAENTAITFLKASKLTNRSRSPTTSAAVIAPLVSLNIQIINTPKIESKNL